MDIYFARVPQRAPLVLALLVTALLLLVVAAALVAAALAGVEPMRLAVMDAAPFRWA